MSAADAVRAARDPQEAILALAEALDRIEAKIDEREQRAAGGWGGWNPPAAQEETVPPAEEARVEIAEDHTDIILKPASPEKQDARRLLATQQLKLNEILRDIDPDRDWNEEYVKGGPLWLYHGNREIVMSYDYDVRQAMVADVLEDSPAQAHLMGIDVLKQPAGEPDLENGSGALAVGWISGKKA